MLEITLWDRMEECTPDEVARLLPLVSSQRREQALRYSHTFGRYCCLKSWLMLRELMEKEHWTMGDFAYNDHGKPYLAGGPCFSISHSKAGIAVAVSDRAVGIDIEHIRHADDELIARTMNEEEARAIRELGIRELADRAFTRLWTRKEAVVKAEGVGIRSFEQLQTLLQQDEWHLESVEKDNYIYSIAYK